MSAEIDEVLSRLVQIVAVPAPSAVAVSGGVDSMTLAVVAGRHGADVVMMHAISPAVPPEATARVRAYAERERWTLEVFDAGEFDDPRYRANPVNRCYFCKSNLYQAMTGLTERNLWSGTNTDDLGDYRPGLTAAEENRVTHPYVEADIDKRLVRALARHHELDDLAELPAAPCLSSRVQTGIAIDPRDLHAIHRAESTIRAHLPAALTAAAVRCRVRGDGIVIELDPPSLEALGSALRPTIASDIQRMFAAHRGDLTVRFETYRMGSAFVHGQAARLESGPRRRP